MLEKICSLSKEKVKEIKEKALNFSTEHEIPTSNCLHDCLPLFYIASCVAIPWVRNSTSKCLFQGFAISENEWNGAGRNWFCSLNAFVELFSKMGWAGS